MNKELYIVGGAVRDELLGLIPKDIDYVAVGYTKQDFIDLGYKQVGKDFPVFLSPEGSEYALARTERSTGLSYSEFQVVTENVSLQDDLRRRDLTLNSIAKASKGNLIDPFGGQKDILNKKLRHTSEAFTEDPLRVLRLARLRSTLGEHWTIVSETKLLVDSMRTSLTTLQPDRVYKEVQRVMSQDNSHLFFETLDELNVLDVIFPNIWNLKNYREGSKWHKEPNVFEHTMSMLKLANEEPSDIKWMILYHDIAKPICRQLYGDGRGHDSATLAEPLIDIKLPNKTKEYVLFNIENHQRIHKIDEMNTKSILKLIKSFKKDERLLEAVLKVSEFDNSGVVRIAESTPTDFTKFCQAFREINSFSPLGWIKVQSQAPNGEQIKQYVHREQLKIISRILKDS